MFGVLFCRLWQGMCGNKTASASVCTRCWFMSEYSPCLKMSKMLMLRQISTKGKKDSDRERESERQRAK